jgi:toxin YoeB
MRLEFKPQAFEDLEYWAQNQPKWVKRVLRIIKEKCGLKVDLQGWWSRRIDGEHRLVYKVEDESLIIAQARGHYG